MIVYVTRGSEPLGGFYHADSKRMPPGPFDQETRVVSNFPQEEWEWGMKSGFPLDPHDPDLDPEENIPSDVYWLYWFKLGTTIWER